MCQKPDRLEKRGELMKYLPFLNLLTMLIEIAKKLLKGKSKDEET